MYSLLNMKPQIACTDNTILHDIKMIILLIIKELKPYLKYAKYPNLFFMDNV